MSRKRRPNYAGCSTDINGNVIRLRYRVRDADGRWRQIARSTGLSNTPDNQAEADQLAQLVGAALKAGRSATEIDAILRRACGAVESPRVPPSLGPTVEDFYGRWIEAVRETERRANLNDYARHIENYVLPAIGHVPLSELTAMDLRALQAELLRRVSDRTKHKLSPKFVRNILVGSLRSMLNAAIEAKLASPDVLPRKMKWPRWQVPKADPFTAEEARSIECYFREKILRQPDGKGGYVSRPYPPFHTYVHLLFWSGLRPSEAAGFNIEDLDLKRGRLEVRRSYHFKDLGEPKTSNARRTVELFPQTVELLRSIIPLHVIPEAPVFTNIEGRRLDPQAFTAHWYDALRALGIRQRGLYCTKDTFVSLALAAR